MKTSGFVLLLTLCLLALQPQANQPVKIIFDTDMGPDYDDVGAIAVLHALAAQGECEILACCASDGYATIAPTIEAFNRYFNRADIPVGAAGKEAPDFTAGNHWNDSIVAMYLKEQKTNASYPSAVDVYRRTLANQENNSVTIVTVGFVSNLAELLKSAPDEFSPLSGLELVKTKVKQWVAMAGRFPEGGEFNVNRHPEASHYVFQHWPTPILFSGWEIGASIFTGRRLADEGSANNPLAWAYRYNLDTYEGKKADKRQSWDQTAVLCAVRNPKDYFYVVGPGKFVIFENGQNAWDPDTNASHYFMVHKYPYQKIADLIDELMLYEPEN
jgi:inosine-uridine nucleoside N-ribohydrolase